MIQPLLLLPFFISFYTAFADGLTTTESPYRCPDGFSLLNDKFCLKLVESPSLFQNASNICKSYSGGNLLSIHNAIDSRAFVNLATADGSVRPIWLGLTCPSSNSYSCNWQDGTTTDYTNFVSGSPQADVGTNVYMLLSGSSSGKWVSADGTLVSLNFICEVPVYKAPDVCPNPLLGYCYSLQDIPFTNESKARQYCQKQCGDLVSIHSPVENYHVQSLMPSNSTQVQLRIGAKTDGSVNYWVDGTAFDFSWIGYSNADIGKCFSMQAVPGIFYPGEWMSIDCEEHIPFVCKWKQNTTSCTPTPGPTANPNCYGNHFYTQNGTIYSPNYPDSYYGISGPCIYIITVPSGYIAHVEFSSFKLDRDSSMTFYTGIEGTDPIIRLTGTSSSSQPIYSRTNVLKMVFENGERVYDSSTNWVANYGF